MNAERRTVMVTGAAGNLGRAVASGFATLGARLALVDRDANRLREAFGGENRDRLLLPTDLLDREATKVAVDRAVDTLGTVDVICNLAGGFRMGEAVHETSDDTWDFLSAINVRTLLNTARAVVPRMLAQGGGKIVNVASFAASHGVARMGAYCAAKSDVIRLTEAMAAELRERNINVNCVLPTIIDTPENRAAMPGSDVSRWVAPDELAAVIVFLASDAARAIHGASIPVTGLS
jgi:NAD(P)-dependent dehydrogenase (short-subunit alcohol dehydrogenase family)